MEWLCIFLIFPFNKKQYITAINIKLFTIKCFLGLLLVINVCFIFYRAHKIYKQLNFGVKLILKLVANNFQKTIYMLKSISIK